MSDAPPPPPYRYAASQAAVVFASYLGAQFAVGLFAGFCMGVWYAATRDQRTAQAAAELVAKATILGGAFGLIAGGVVAQWLAKRAIRREAQGLTLATFGWTGAAPGAQFFALLAGVLLGIAFIASTFVFPLPSNWRPGLIAKAVGIGGWPLYMWALLALAIAPPIEEFVFRGMLWTGFSRSWNALAAGIVVTAAFALMHLPEAGGYPPAMVSITLMGIAALAARIVSGSLAPAILLHVGYNAVVVCSVFAGDR